MKVALAQARVILQVLAQVLVRHVLNQFVAAAKTMGLTDAECVVDLSALLKLSANTHDLLASEAKLTALTSKASGWTVVVKRHSVFTIAKS